MIIESTINLELPIALVFEKVSNPLGFPQWMQNFRSRQPLGNSDTAVGNQAEHIQEALGRKIKFIETIQEVNPPYLFRIQLDSKDIDVNVTYQLSALSPDLTCLVVTEEITLKAFFMRTVSGLVKSMMQKRQEEDLLALKKYILTT